MSKNKIALVINKNPINFQEDTKWISLTDLYYSAKKDYPERFPKSSTSDRHIFKWLKLKRTITHIMEIYENKTHQKRWVFNSNIYSVEQLISHYNLTIIKVVKGRNGGIFAIEPIAEWYVTFMCPEYLQHLRKEIGDYKYRLAYYEVQEEKRKYLNDLLDEKIKEVTKERGLKGGNSIYSIVKNLVNKQAGLEVNYKQKKINKSLVQRGITQPKQLNIEQYKAETKMLDEAIYFMRNLENPVEQRIPKPNDFDWYYQLKNHMINFAEQERLKLEEQTTKEIN